MAAKPVLISGAGLSSLLFAQSLRHSRIPFHIFERDTSITFRAQGYRLRLSSEGLDAIEQVLTPAQFQTFWETCGKTRGSGLTAVDAVTGEDVSDGRVKANGERGPRDEEAKGGKMKLESREGLTVGIARGDMRRLFMQGCEEFISWGRHVTGYELTPEGVRAVFADGTKSVEGSLLVGGEGIYSKVARQVSKGALKVYDTGARGIHGQAPTTAFKGLGEGVWRFRDERSEQGKVFVITNVRSGDMDDPNIQFGWTMGAEPGVINPPNNDYTIIGKPAADIAKALTNDWNPRFKPLFDEMNETEAAFWKITCSTPTGVPEWTNEPRVTVIGDAAHSMTPAGGIGANTAVQDSALLGRLLREKGGWWNGVTAAYEKEMRIYGSEAVRMSYGAARNGFGIEIDVEKTPTVNGGDGFSA